MDSLPNLQPSLDQSFQLLLVDSDPVFRLGFKTGLASFPQVEVVAETASPRGVFELLPQLILDDSLRWDPSMVDEPMLGRVNLVVLDLNLEQGAGTLLCEQLRSRYPTLPILILTGQLMGLREVRQLGIEGYWLKGTSLEKLVEVMQAILAGEISWDPNANAQLAMASAPAPVEKKRWSAFASLRQSARTSGLTQISTRLTDLENQLRNPNLSWLERQVLTGREREVRAAQWVVRRLPVATESQQPPPVKSPVSPKSDAPLARRDPNALPNPQFDTIKTLLLDGVFAKLSTSLENQTRDPLEIDILNRPKKQELFVLILKRFEDLLDDLRFSQVSQVLEKRSHLLVDLWQATITDYFGKYLTLPQADAEEVEMVSTLLEDRELVIREILDPIPQVTELLNHLLFQIPLLVNNGPCAVGSPEAMFQAQALLENLLVQLANAVMQPLLNHFATTEVIKQRFYDRRLLSTRDIER
ncbi:MAG: DUF3685 domain-containing protein, partial [Cyanobacteria bacterium P01_A01_bin.17]